MDDASYTGGGAQPAQMRRYENLVTDSYAVPTGISAYTGFQVTTRESRGNDIHVSVKKPQFPKGRQQSFGPNLDASTPAERYAIRRHLTRAKTAAADVARLAEAQDPMGLACAAGVLKESLRQLWRLRRAREDDWASVLNFVQSALSRGALERLTVEQASAISTIIVEHLSAGAVSDDQPSEVRKLLRAVGLDAWRAVSPAGNFTDD